MGTLSQLKITTKIVGLLIMLGLVVIGVAIYGSARLADVNTSYGTLTQKTLPSAAKLARVNRLAVQMMYDSYRVLYYPGSSAVARSADKDEQISYDAAMVLISQVVEDEPALAEKATVMLEQLNHLHDLTRQSIAYGLKDQNELARPIMMEGDKVTEELSAFARTTNDAVVVQAANASKDLGEQTDDASTSMLVGGLLAVLVAVGGGILVAQVGITAPLNRLKGAMASIAGGNNSVEVTGTARGDEIGAMAKTVLVFRDAAVALAAANAAKQRADAEQAVVLGELTTNLRRLSEGDLTARISADVAPDYRDLKQNFNNALESLGDTIGAVSTGAEAIRTGSMEIAQASEDLARRTEANAASLEETSAALVQIDGRLKASVAASAKTVARADQAIATVESGRTTAGEAVAAMGRVRESAKGIDDVIEGLDKIAFQTRVLAMNAAVEAGRAGDAGRGFAVVADLVSALAMRAEEEAKNARAQLTVTQAEVGTAVAAVEKVDGAFVAISGDVDEVHALLRSIASDSAAQATGISEITVAVGTMDKSTQQNAAMVEETSAAARNLNNEVGELTARTAAFNTGRSTAMVANSDKRVEAKRVQSQMQMLSKATNSLAARSKAEMRLAVAGAVANGRVNGHATGADHSWSDF